MEQAETVRHELHRFLDTSGYVSARARTQHLVVLPHSRLPRAFDPTSCPRGQVIDAEELGDLVPRVRDLVERGSGFAPLDAEAVPAVVRLFEQKLLPDDMAEVREHEQRAEHFALQQVDVLDLLSLQNSFTIIGGAGTGKTGLALERARRLVNDGKRVALVCYSRGLARVLQLQTQQWPKKPAFVGTFERLALEWGSPEGSGDDHYETELPTALREAAQGRRDRFDAVVVDEAQDFGELWWPAMTACLRTPEGGGVFAFLDEGQRVFERRSTAQVSAAGRAGPRAV